MFVATVNTLRNNRGMKKTWAELAKTRMKDAGITQDRAAEAIGKTQGAVDHWLNGRRQPSIKDIASIMKAIGLKELVLNADGTVNSPDEGKANAINPRMHVEAKEYPLISWVSAGQWAEAIEPYSINEIDKWPETTANADDKSFWLDSDNEATFKRYIVDAGNKYLKPLNPAYSMIPISGNCRIIGVVIEAKWEGL